MIYLASDHAGFEAKKRIFTFLQQKDYEVEDLGPYEYVKTDDYPDYAFKLGEKVASESGASGIILCGSGVGVCIATNKVKGIRAAYAESLQHAVQSKQDDDANVLVLDTMTFTPEVDFPLIETWLQTEFSGLERHQRRVNKIIAYENSH